MTARAPTETFFFAYRAENKVGMLLGDIFELGLCAVQESFAEQAARPYGYFRLVDVIAGAAQVFFKTEDDFDAHLLMGLQMVEGES